MARAPKVRRFSSGRPNQAQVGTGDAILEGGREHRRGARGGHRKREPVGGRRRDRYRALGDQHRDKLITPGAVRVPVGQRLLLPAPAQVRTCHPVAVRGRVLGRQRRLQRRDRAVSSVARPDAAARRRFGRHGRRSARVDARL